MLYPNTIIRLLIVCLAACLLSCGDDDPLISDEPQIENPIDSVLVSIKVQGDNLAEGMRGFVFLSDVTGSLIASTEYSNGDSVVLYSSQFEGSEFYLSQGLLYNNGEELEIITYTKVNKGRKWVLYKVYTSEESEYPYRADLKFQNAKEGTSYRVSAHDQSISYFGVNVENGYNTDLKTNPSDIYIVASNDQDQFVKYGVFTEITEGDNLVDLGLVNNDIVSKTLAIPESLNMATIGIRAYPNSFNSGFYVCFRDQFTDEGFNISYPKEGFSDYYTQVYYENDKFEYGQRTYGEDGIYIGTMNYDYDLMYDGEVIKYSVSGDLDFMIFDIEKENVYHTWLVPFGEGKVVSLELPQELTNFDASLDQPEYINFRNILDIHTYSEWLDFISKSDNNLMDIFELGVNFQELSIKEENSGGKLSNRRGKLPIIL
ncbi:hypothetical protein [Fulvivirga sediminis]|uniref:Uncharacterized protein n=1 Tax=Fulvivirga sediminis TaxID=2803949 RepID=A0A937F9B2_9BACT|nr:hypothetical protein [Fulvivirga sediminis]MBL3656659.1 hypothetical protein [Fulvivirga sediminis]